MGSTQIYTSSPLTDVHLSDELKTFYIFKSIKGSIFKKFSIGKVNLKGPHHKSIIYKWIIHFQNSPSWNKLDRHFEN